MDRKKVENILAMCIFTTFTGQFYFTPFNSNFRFSLSVTVLALMLLYFKDIPILLGTNMVGGFVLVFRCFVYMISNPQVTLGQVLGMYYQVAIFYMFFGIMFELFDIREKIKVPQLGILFLWFCETIPNVVEISINRENINYAFENEILYIIMIGILRTLVTVNIYYVIIYYRNRYNREQSEKKYRELVMFIANLKTELFFLRKSTIDIEDAMSKSYALYEKLREDELKEDALSVAKDIHEIKKDYMRVATGIEKTISEENKSSCMGIKEIFGIIRDNTQKVLDITEKKIVLKFQHENNLTTQEFYPLISILNNLIINAIEAMNQDGHIMVTQVIEGEDCIFNVIDDGSGIEQEDVDLIFEPGFSTKFNAFTGEMSTGIGLTHVKQLIEKHFNGSIIVCSRKDINTIFTIRIPKFSIMQRK
ncbi:hypothetical protein IZY60_00745 [Lutibacter sp. B2]|nr:hypothetical protein [Lutibacter sp. B2]